MASMGAPSTRRTGAASPSSTPAPARHGWAVSYGLLAAYASSAAATAVFVLAGGTRHPTAALAGYGLVAACVAARIRPAAAPGVALIGWMFDSGFIIGRHAHLTWQGSADVRRLAILLAVAVAASLLGSRLHTAGRGPAHTPTATHHTLEGRPAAARDGRTSEEPPLPTASALVASAPLTTPDKIKQNAAAPMPPASSRGVSPGSVQPQVDRSLSAGAWLARGDDRARREEAELSASAKFAGFHGSDERAPLASGEQQCGSLPVLGVADGYHAGQVACHLDAGRTVRAVGAGAPLGAAQVWCAHSVPPFLPGGDVPPGSSDAIRSGGDERG